ncbi:MAG: hypothetical protein IJR78_03790 [Clostridia bacterium]|nr:hypothetical protein [Clostridia bacterium]
MNYTISEKKVLKKLGIPDFRHMTKDKVMNFASMLPYMDPGVAKKALEQFPSFKDLAGDMVTQYKAIVDRAFEENRISQQAFYDVCNEIISSLQIELQDENIDSEERARIEDKMIKVAGMIGDKDRENKGMILKILGGASVFFLLLIGTVATALGSNSRFSAGDNQLTDEDDDDVIES